MILRVSDTNTKERGSQTPALFVRAFGHVALAFRTFYALRFAPLPAGARGCIDHLYPPAEQVLPDQVRFPPISGNPCRLAAPYQFFFRGIKRPEFEIEDPEHSIELLKRFEDLPAL